MSIILKLRIVIIFSLLFSSNLHAKTFCGNYINKENCFRDLIDKTKHGVNQCKQNAQNKAWNKFDPDLFSEYEKFSLLSEFTRYFRSSDSIYADEEKIRNTQYARDSEKCEAEARASISEIQIAFDDYLNEQERLIAAEDALKREKAKKVQVAKDLQAEKILSDKIKLAKRIKNIQSDIFTNTITSDHQGNLCGMADIDLLKILFIWKRISEEIDPKLAKSCLQKEEIYLRSIELKLLKSSQEADLKSNSIKHLRKSEYIKKNIRSLASANCIWKSMASLNEPLIEKREANLRALDAQGMGFLAGFAATDTYIDYETIFKDLNEGNYNIPAVFRKVNIKLTEDPESFKTKYFNSEDLGTNLMKRQLRENERQRSFRRNSPEDKIMNTQLTGIDLMGKLRVPLYLESIATGNCSSNEHPSIVFDYLGASTP